MGQKCQDGESGIEKDKRKREGWEVDGRLDQFAVAALPKKTAEVTVLTKCISHNCIFLFFIF